MVLTLDVISCHVPSMLSTLAVTPRFPLVPTSCATRVTSLAKVASFGCGVSIRSAERKAELTRSTMELIVMTRRKTSPFASIVTF